MLIFSTEASAMFKVCLFSPVIGKVVLKGQPVVGAIIERTCKWNWKNEEESDQTVTDEKGEFSLPGIHSWMGIVQLVPHEPVIHQHIVIQHNGATYNAWYHIKHKYKKFAELDNAKASGTLPDLNGKPIDLYCELTGEPKNHGGVWGYGGLAELRGEQSATLNQPSSPARQGALLIATREAKTVPSGIRIDADWPRSLGPELRL